MQKTVLVFCLLLVPLLARAEQIQLQLDRTNLANNKVGELRFMGAVVIPMGATKIGGLSDLYVGPKDTDLVAEADTGKLYTGHLQWTAGRLTGATLEEAPKLLDENGSSLTTRARYDAESMARLPNGDWLMGYERDHRIEQFKDDHGKPSGIPVPFAVPPPGLADLPRNEGLEALTVLNGGGVLAVAEYVEGGASPAWLWQEGHWSKLTYRPADGLAPSDAATLPNGDVVVLERELSLLYGFRCRIALIKATDLRAGAALDGKELARLESPLLSENFEGITATKGPDGTVRLFIISDNNVNTIQQTILAAFELTAPASPNR